METFSHYILARAIHVAGVVLWIGGVLFVTTVLLPALQKMDGTVDRLSLFEALEGRFATQARIVTLITGASGLYMLYVLNAWDRFLSVEFWWMHLMTLIWALFTLVLFILEPLFLHDWFRRAAVENPEATFKRIQRLHWILSSLSLLAIIGAVAGAHGYRFG